jgi:hypothetical protein
MIRTVLTDRFGGLPPRLPPNWLHERLKQAV